MLRYSQMYYSSLPTRAAIMMSMPRGKLKGCLHAMASITNLSPEKQMIYIGTGIATGRRHCQGRLRVQNVKHLYCSVVYDRRILMQGTIYTWRRQVQQNQQV
jgi:hypothetical protein